MAIIGILIRNGADITLEDKVCGTLLLLSYVARLGVKLSKSVSILSFEMHQAPIWAGLWECGDEHT